MARRESMLKRMLSYPITTDSPWWLLIFEDGEIFQGAVLLRAGNCWQASHEAHRMGVAPNGRMTGINLTELLLRPEAWAGYSGRLLSEDELKTMKLERMHGET
jgi:hypothetical protein